VTNVPRTVTISENCGTITDMAGTAGNGVAGHFARQMKKERLAHGWSLAELARRMGGTDPAHLGRIENGRRPPTEAVAAGLDSVFPVRRGWFADWLSESRDWPEVPATFRSWPDFEDRAAAIRTWTPGIVDGLVQSEDYARALIAVQPAITAEAATARLTARLDRQRRVLDRKDPPPVWVIVDEMAMYRLVGSPEVMAGQMRRLLAVAAMPQVTMTVMPGIAHAANASGFVLADDAAWCEHLAAGGVFTDPQIVSALAARFDSLRAESYRASESAAMIAKAGQLWTAGANPATQMATAASA
jgi:transcriptional regulator with XRE-family HTH domain